MLMALTAKHSKDGQKAGGGQISWRKAIWFCTDSTELPMVIHTKIMLSMMVIAVVSNKGCVMPLFLQCLRVNATG